MRALILVDLQNDFCPGGALAVERGNAAIMAANELIPQFDIVVATQDWHPPNHGSFANNRGAKVGTMGELGGLPQVMWPVHCVQDTPGAEFHATLDPRGTVNVFKKGTDPTIDSYSGFFDNGHRKSTGMGEWLQSKGVTDVTVLGLATDYCVKFTVLDAIQKFGFRTTLITRGSFAVNAKPGDGDAAIEAMRAAGAIIE